MSEYYTVDAQKKSKGRSRYQKLRAAALSSDDDDDYEERPRIIIIHGEKDGRRSKLAFVKSNDLWGDTKMATVGGHFGAVSIWSR